jgi:hypothetical protein
MSNSRPAMTALPFPFFAPLSGPVSQAFDFWSGWFESVGQIGLVNIDLGRTPDPDLERRILDEAGSYGRQIGRMSEALEVLLKAAEENGLLAREKLTDGDIAALHDFREMLARVTACKDHRQN